MPVLQLKSLKSYLWQNNPLFCLITHAMAKSHVNGALCAGLVPCH